MDVLDKFFTKYSYKFPKGYPDMKDAQDILLMESILEELGVEMNIIETTQAEDALKILKKELELTDEDFLKKNNVRYKILVPGIERIEVIKKINAIDGFEYDPDNPASSIGAITYGNITFEVKPSEVQGRASSGMKNEDDFINQISPYLIGEPKNIIFKSPNKTLVTKKIKEIITTGYDTKDTKKADVILRGVKSYPLSMKKNNAGFWESADVRYKDIVNKLSQKIKKGDFAPNLIFKPFVNKLGNIKKDIFIMWDGVNNKKITGIIVKDLPDNQAEDIIFGTDNTKIIYQSFDEIFNLDDVYNLKDNNLTVKVTKIIEDMDDVKKYGLEPILNIRHDSTRSPTSGLRATVIPYNLAYTDDILTGDKIELSHSKIID